MAAAAGKISGVVNEELLFDTSALIDIYLGRRRIQPYFTAVLDSAITPYLSVITEAELWRGLRAGELDRHHQLMSQFITLPLQSEAARLAGTWMQRYEHQGLGWMDALITATANVAAVTVLTRDKKLTTVLHTEAQFELFE